MERALRADGRNSGHFVQGHVDCTAKIIEKWQEGDSLWIKMQVPPEYIRYIVPKGFICIDGASLTVCDVVSSNDINWFTIMLVQHTQESVIFPMKQIGDAVNIEVDVMGKIVESSLQGITSQLQSSILALQTQNKQLIERIEVLEAGVMKYRDSKN